MYASPSIAAQPTTDREAEIPSELRQLRETVDRTAEVAHALCERLGGVSRSGSEGAKNASAVPQQVLCPVADALRTIRERCEHVEQTLHAQLGLLEV